MKTQQSTIRPASWTLALRSRVAALERALSEPMPYIKGHSKAAEKRRAGERTRRRELRGQVEQLIPVPHVKCADNGIHEFVETQEYIVFRNHGQSWWAGIQKAAGGFAFIETCRSRLQHVALDQMARALVERKKEPQSRQGTVPTETAVAAGEN